MIKIVELREKTALLKSDIRNAVITFSRMNISLVAVVTDCVQNGKPVIGYGLHSNGRYAQGGILRERLFPRVLDAVPEEYNEEKYGLDTYPNEDIKIGMVYEKMGLDEKADNFFRAYADYCETDQSIYKSFSTAIKYVQEGKNDQAIEQLKVFAKQDNYKYWILVFMEIDPIMSLLKSHPEYDETIQNIKDRFWENQAQLRKSLEEQGLIN